MGRVSLTEAHPEQYSADYLRLFFEQDIKGDLIWMMTNIRGSFSLRHENFFSLLTMDSSILASV